MPELRHSKGRSVPLRVLHSQNRTWSALKMKPCMWDIFSPEVSKIPTIMIPIRPSVETINFLSPIGLDTVLWDGTQIRDSEKKWKVFLPIKRITISFMQSGR